MLELLLVVAILVLLFTLYWSPASGSKQRALQATCQRNLQKLAVSVQLFATDNGGKFPAISGARKSSEALAPLVPKYTSDVFTFICPGSTDSVSPGTASLNNQKISYAYYMGRDTNTVQDALITDAQIDTSAKTAGQQLFSADGKAPGNNHDKSGGNLMFCDGHVQTSGAKAAFDLPVGTNEALLNP